MSTRAEEKIREAAVYFATMYDQQTEGKDGPTADFIADGYFEGFVDSADNILTCLQYELPGFKENLAAAIEEMKNGERDAEQVVEIAAGWIESFIEDFKELAQPKSLLKDTKKNELKIK